MSWRVFRWILEGGSLCILEVLFLCIVALSSPIFCPMNSKCLSLPRWSAPSYQFKASAGLCLHSSSLCKSLDSLSRNSLGKLETSPHVLPVSQESLSFTALYTMPLKPLSHILCLWFGSNRHQDKFSSSNSIFSRNKVSRELLKWLHNWFPYFFICSS